MVAEATRAAADRQATAGDKSHPSINPGAIASGFFYGHSVNSKREKNVEKSKSI